MKLPDDTPDQAKGIATIFVALGLAGAWLWNRLTGGGEETPMKAEVIPEGGKLIVEIPIKEVLDRQDQTLNRIEAQSTSNALALERVEEGMKNLGRRLDEGQVWATDVQKQLNNHGERIARLEGKVRRFHDGDE